MQFPKFLSAPRAPRMRRRGVPAHPVLPPSLLLPQYPYTPIPLLLPTAPLPAVPGCPRESLGQSKGKNTATYMLHICAPALTTSPLKKLPWGTSLPNVQFLPCSDHAACPMVLPALLVLMETMVERNSIVACRALEQQVEPAGMQIPGKGAFAEG